MSAATHAPPVMGSVAAAEAADAAEAARRSMIRRPPPVVRERPAPLADPGHGLMGPADDGEMPAAAELLIEEAHHLLKVGEYDRVLTTLEQATVVAPRDGSVHLLKALARCKAASAELDNIKMLSDLPEWGDLALRSRRVEMDVDIWREIRAAQGKRRTTGDEKRFNSLLAHTRRLADETKKSIDQYNSTVDEDLAPFEVDRMEQLHALVRELRSEEPKIHANAVQQLIALVLPNPRLSPEEAEAAKAKKISDCLKIARMERGVGLHTMIVTLNSAGEQNQWVAITVICTVLEYDHATHEAFVSLGGLQGLVGSLASVSSEVQAMSLQTLQHVANSRALGSEQGTVDGVQHVIRASALPPIVGLFQSEFHVVASAAADLARVLVSRSEHARDELYGAGAVDALSARLRLLLPHHGARPVPHGGLPTDWGVAPDKTVRNLLPGVAHQDVIDATRKRLIKVYADHKPRKLDDVDALLEEWRGVEDELLYLVERKYDFPSALKRAQAALVEAEKIHSLATRRKEKKAALIQIEDAWHALKDEVPDLQQAYAALAAAEDEMALAQAQCGGRKAKQHAAAALLEAKTDLERQKNIARTVDDLAMRLRETNDAGAPPAIADHNGGIMAAELLEAAERDEILVEDPGHQREEEVHQQHGTAAQGSQVLVAVDEHVVADPDALAETALRLVAHERTVGPVTCRAALVDSLRAFVSHRTDVATAAVQSPHGLCEALTYTLWSDAPKNHANTLRLLHALCTVEEIPPETPPDPQAPPPVNWRAEAQQRVKDCEAVQVCAQILRTDDLDAIAWAARMVQVLGRGADEKGCTETKHRFKEVGAVEALVKVLRGYEDHCFDDQARKQAKVALDVLEIDGPDIEREIIRQELIESQSALCETILHLAPGNSFRTRLGAAAWVRTFVFDHGSKSQDTALAEGIIPLLVDCLREFGPASGMSDVETNEALDGFGSLLLIVLRPELPNDPSRYAFAQAERLFGAGEYFEASVAYTQAIHARHPNLRDCFLARSACYTAMDRPDDAAQDTTTAAKEWLTYCRATERIARTLMSLPDHEDPELEVYIATAISFGFRGLLEASDELVIEAFQKIIDVADKACRERYSDIMIDVGPGAPIRWQRAAYDVVYSIARFEAVADKIAQLVSPRLEMKDRYTLYVCVVSSLRLKDELTHSIEAQDTAVATWAFRILGDGRPVVTPAPIGSETPADILAIEDRAVADAVERERKQRALDKRQQAHLLNRQKEIITAAKAEIHELSVADEIDVSAVKVENEKIVEASAKVKQYEQRLAEMEAEDALAEAENAVANVDTTEPQITNKYLKVDGIQATAWLLQHPSCVDKGTKSEMVAALVQFIVWITMHSPHMQQVALADTVIFNSLFESIAERPASFWGTCNDLVDLLEDMTRSEVPMMHEYLMKAGILVGLEGCLGDPTLTKQSAELMAVIIYNMSKHASALRIVVDTALDFPLQGILERVGQSLDADTQTKCLQAIEALVQVDAGTSLGMVGQACEKAAKSLVQNRTGVDPTGARWDQTILARANVLVDLITGYFRAAFDHLRETKDGGDMAAVFSYLVHPGRKLRIAALQLLVEDARNIEGPSRALSAAPQELVSWRLVIIGARGLPRADGPFAKSDPYTVVRWNGRLLGQTNVKIQTLEPIWEEDFVLMLPVSQEAGDLHLQVYDYDRVSDHDFMAGVHLRVGDSEVPQRRALRVRVIEARDLPKMDLLGKNDPYVAVTVDDGELRRTTAIDGGGAEPEWNQELQWDLMVAAVPRVKIMCYDEDVGSADDLIGSAVLRLESMSADEAWELDDWVSLESPGVTGCGAVHVIVTWDPEPDSNVDDAMPAHKPAHGAEFKLCATVIQCEGLPKSDTFGKNDVYVGLAAARQSRKTKTLDGAGANPVWCDGDGEELHWNLCEAPNYLDVTVWDEDVGSADDLIGQCQIPLQQHLSDTSWVQEGWFHLEDIKERSAGRVKLRLEWSVIHVLKDASVTYTLNRELLNRKNQLAGKIELRVEKLAQKVPEPPPVDVVAQAEHRQAVPDGNKVVDDDYIAAVDLVARLCRLKAMETEEKQELVLDLLEAVRMRCLTDHSSMPIAHARLVDTVCNGSHELIMIAVESVKVKVFDRFWRDELHGYKWMIARATNPEDARNCLVASAQYLAPDSSPVQLDSVAAWAAKEHRVAVEQEQEPDRCILDILLYVAQIHRGRTALLKVVDLRLLMRLLQLVENPELDEEKVDAIRLWAVAGIPVMLDSEAEQHAFVQHSGIDLLLPLINFTKKNCYDASKHVCEILWEIADILDTIQFEHIVFTMCEYEQCRELLDKSELRPFIRILDVDPAALRDEDIAGWAVDWVNTLMQRQDGALPNHLAIMNSTGYKVLRKTAESAPEQIACNAIAALSSYIHQQRHIDELATLLWFVEATEIDHVHAILPTLDATVVEMFVRQMWEPHAVLDRDISRHHLYIASCAIVRYMCRPPTHPTRAQPTVTGRTGWGATHGEKGITDWAESLPFFSPLLSFCFCASTIAPLAVILPLPAVVAIGQKREEQSVLTLLIGYLGLSMLSLTTFVLWATRDRSFRAATQFQSPDWRSENFWGVGVTQVYAWFRRRWLEIKQATVWCRRKCPCCAKRNVVGPSWGEVLFNEGDAADRYRVDGGTPGSDDSKSDGGKTVGASKLTKFIQRVSQSREVISRNLSRGALESRASSVQMGFRRATQTADGSLKRCAKQLQTPRGKEAMYIAIDFAQFNGFCFLNHPCWRSSGFFGQLLARGLALSHLQLSSDLSASGSILAWTAAILVVFLYVLGSKCMLITLNVKLQKFRHRFCSKVKIVPTFPPPKHAIDNDNIELMEFATRAGLPLDPTPASYESDCRRMMRKTRAFVLYLISNRFLLVFIGSAGFVPVTSHLMAAGACSYPMEYGRNYGPPKIARPPISPDHVCWDSTHRGLLWGSLAGLGLFVPLVLLVEPMLQVAERGMAEVHAQQAQSEVSPDDKSSKDEVVISKAQQQLQSSPLVVQWTPGYNACRAMGKLVLVTVAAWLPGEPMLLDICILLVAGLLATACIVVSPCSVHGILKFHVVVLASAMVTAAVSLHLRLNITGLPTADSTAVSEMLEPASELWIDGTMDEHCSTAQAFWLLILAWGVLAGITCFYRIWWGCLSNVWGRLMAIRAEEALNKKVLALAL